MTRLVLVGGGHAHLEVLRRLGEDAAPSSDASLDLVTVSLSDRHHYSGMVPGYLAGTYGESDLAVPLAPLVEAAGGRFVRAEVTGIDPESRTITNAAREAIPYDLASFDVGSRAAGQTRPDVARYARSVKPIGRAIELWEDLRALAESDHRPAHAVIVGAGAAGVEVAFAVARMLEDRAGAGGGRRVTLVDAGPRILSSYPETARRKAERLLARRSVHVVTGRPVARVEEDRVVLEGDEEIPSHLTIWLTGPEALPLFEGSGLALDDRGFLRVGPSLRSVSHPEVFGAGDCVTLDPAPETPKAGVYAVREGPVLFESLRAAMTVRAGTPEEAPAYEPQRGYLSLLNTADGRALLSWKGFAAHSRWAWWLKDFIDRRFVRKYR